MKVIGGIVCLVLVLMWAGSMGDESEAETSSAQPTAVEDVSVSDTSSETGQILELTGEGETLANEIVALAEAATADAKAGDMEAACAAFDEINPKIDRLEVIVDDLTYMDSVPASQIADMRLQYTEMRAQFASAEEYC